MHMGFMTKASTLANLYIFCPQNKNSYTAMIICEVAIAILCIVMYLALLIWLSKTDMCMYVAQVYASFVG